jgi:hypothetical protein
MSQLFFFSLVWSCGFTKTKQTIIHRCAEAETPGKGFLSGTWGCEKLKGVPEVMLYCIFISKRFHKSFRGYIRCSYYPTFSSYVHLRFNYIEQWFEHPFFYFRTLLGNKRNFQPKHLKLTLKTYCLAKYFNFCRIFSQ